MSATLDVPVRPGVPLVPPHEAAKFSATYRVLKYSDRLDDWTDRLGEEEGTRQFFEANKPYEIVEAKDNLLMYGGASCLIECLIGNGTATGSQTLTYFNNGNAYLGTGDSATAEAATQTDLQASSNKSRRPMDATYPTHTDGTTSGAATVRFQATWTSTGNYAWNEFGIFNASTGGRMLSRKVQSLGTKTSGTWVLQVDATIA